MLTLAFTILTKASAEAAAHLAVIPSDTRRPDAVTWIAVNAALLVIVLVWRDRTK